MQSSVCGYRGSSSGWLIEDPYFWQNLQNAKKAGVKVGIYFFTQATTMVEAVEEASMVVTLLGGETLDYPVFIDTEGAGGNGRADGLDADTRTMVCESFCRTIENAGYQAGVYASCNWYRNNLHAEIWMHIKYGLLNTVRPHSMKDATICGSIPQVAV